MVPLEARGVFSQARGQIHRLSQGLHLHVRSHPERIDSNHPPAPECLGHSIFFFAFLSREDSIE